MTIAKRILFTLLSVPVLGALIAIPADAEPTSKVVMASEIEWQQLNPKRGDASPKAATLWGDRHGTEETGFLVKFVDGFESPPHIHNVTYRGVVISGLVHNDDPDAAPMWMPKGSYWTQPAGEVHITAAKGSENVAFIEIEEAPYLVMPADEAFDRGERPVNVDPSNLVWLDASNTSWVSQSKNADAAKGAKIAFLWGEHQEGGLNGTMLKLPAGFKGTIQSQGLIRAVVIDGNPKYTDQGKPKMLTPGSYVTSNGTFAHKISCATECVVYLRAKGRLLVEN